jgi:hypothetical protein
MGNTQNRRASATMGGGASQPTGTQGANTGQNNGTNPPPNGIFGGGTGTSNGVRNTNELTAEQLQLLIQAGRLQYGGSGTVNDMIGGTVGGGVDGGAPTPQFRSAKVTKNPFNLKKNSIRFKTNEDGTPTSPRCIEFDFDAAEPCVVSLYYYSREYVTPKHLTVKFVSEPNVPQALVVPSVNFQAGMNQTYTMEHTDQHRFDFESVPAPIKHYSETSSCYPVIIDLRSIPSSSNPTELHQTRTAQTTFLTLDANCSKLKTVKQKVSVGGQAYELHDIYGISANIGTLLLLLLLVMVFCLICTVVCSIN